MHRALYRLRALVRALITAACCLGSTVGYLLPSACCLWPVPSPAALGPYEVKELRPSVFAWIPDDVIDQQCDPLFPRTGTAGFILTTEGVVVVDTGNSPIHGRDLLYEIRQRTDLAIRYVINTSADPDHMLGNEVFTDEEAEVISTTAAQAAMRQYGQEVRERSSGEEGWRLRARMRGFHITPSTRTFDDQMTLTLGGQEIRLLRGTAPPEDSVVYLPAARLLFLGELFDNHYFPHIGARDVRRWIEALRQFESWQVDTYVPGHGAPGGKSDVADFRKFLEWLVGRVETEVKQGKSADQIQKALLLPGIYHWHARERAAEDVADVCRQLVPQPASDPPAPPQARRQ